MRIARATAVAATTALLIASSACGSSPTARSDEDTGPTKAEKVYQAVGQLSGKERRDKLVKLAQEEGTLDFYTSMTSDVANAVAEAFSDSFDVDVNVYRAGSETVLQRILQESGAGYAGSDVVETNTLEMFALNKEGLLADYKGERRDMVANTGQFPGWTATRYNLFSPSWNTKQVKPADAPKSWEDLADPKWNGKLAMELSDYDWYLSLYGYWEKQGKSKQEIDKLFADMADGAKIVKGHTVMGELLSAGQFSVAASNYTYLVQHVMDKGAPVNYRPLVQPVIARPNGVGLVKTANHPAAAMLFYDWLLEEGQQVLVDQGLTPSIAPPGSPDELKGVEVIPVDVETLLKDSETWSKKYDELVAKGEQQTD
jgi:iron(III) transport system substrate-binding protein